MIFTMKKLILMRHAESQPLVRPVLKSLGESHRADGLLAREIGMVRATRSAGCTPRAAMPPRSMASAVSRRAAQSSVERPTRALPLRRREHALAQPPR